MLSNCRTCDVPTVPEDLEPLYGQYRTRRCKYCAQKASRRRKPPNKTYHRNYFLQRAYGISLEQYDVMRAAQGNSCAICRKTHDKPLNVDHDHKTGRVRGLLCTLCNTALGKLQDDPALLRAAAAYLEQQ